MGCVERIKRKEVKKHVATIHCSNSLSLLQRKISNVLLYHAYPNLNSCDEHQLTIKQLCELIGYSGHNHAAIKDALRGLVATVVEWNVVEDSDEEDWTASTILASVRLKGAVCSYAYSPRMRELLFSPSMYAKINLIVQSKFKSNYGLALYENCIRYQSLPYTKWFNVELFRKLMGVPEDTYQIFRDFKRRVLDKAVEEVNTYSEMKINAEIERVGHKVTNIRFKLKKQEKAETIGICITNNSSPNTVTEISPLMRKLTGQFRIERTKAQEIIDKHGYDNVEKKVKYIEESKAYSKGSISNMAGYLIDALRNDYQKVNVHESVNENFKRQRQEASVNKMKEEQDSKVKRKYEAYVGQKIDSVLEQLSIENKQKLFNEFEQYLEYSNPSYALIYKNNDLTNILIRSAFRDFLILSRSKYTLQLISYEEFTTKDGELT